MDLAGRRYLNGNCEEGDCCICGGRLDEKSLDILKALGKTYTDFDNTIKHSGNQCCSFCQKILGISAFRTKHIFCTSFGNPTIIQAAEVWYILESPPLKFVLSVPYSYKKHHWIFAGLSNPQKMMIGTDNRTVEYCPQKHSDIKNAVADLIQRGVPTTQIISGNYHPSIASRVGRELDQLEAVISRHRVSGLVEFLTKYAPKAEPQAKKFQGDDRMITTEQSNAAMYLSIIANGSGFRITNGKQFWGGFFEHRINRVLGYDFDTATSKLLEAVDFSVMSTSLAIFLQEITNETKQAIMDTLKKQTKLCVALAYDQLKRGRE